MTDEQITALAREYAEEYVKQPEDMPNSLHNEYLKLFADSAEEIICFLLRRYCLVEKSKVQEIYACNEEILSADPTHSGARLLKKKLTELFGPKCQPDDTKNDTMEEAKEPTPASLPNRTIQENLIVQKN